MRKAVMLVLAAAFFLAGACGGSTIVRDEVTYRTELNFMEQASRQSADHLAKWVGENCNCNGGRFTTALCLTSADLVQVIRARIPWHKQMMLFNAGITERRPSVKPPTIPPATDLCPKGE